MPIFCRFSSIKSNSTRLSNAAMLDIKMNVEKDALRRYIPKHRRIKPIVLRTAKTLPSSMIAISYLFSQKHGAAKMAERHENARHFWRHSCPAHEVVINHNASSFVDLLWRRQYLSKINTPKI